MSLKIEPIIKGITKPVEVKEDKIDLYKAMHLGLNGKVVMVTPDHVIVEWADRQYKFLRGMELHDIEIGDFVVGMPKSPRFFAPHGRRKIRIEFECNYDPNDPRYIREEL